MSTHHPRLVLVAITGLVVAGLGGAAFHPAFPAAVSQVEWMRSHEATDDDWDTGDVIFWPTEPTGDSRGSHPESTKCSACHFNGPPGTTAPSYPPDTWGAACGRTCHNDKIISFEAVDWDTWPREFEGQEGFTDHPCGTACHSWLKEIDQQGFPNVLPAIQGESAYQDSIDPLYLLSEDKDMNGNGRSHQAIYEEFGCRGFCHNPNVDRQEVTAWATSGVAPTDELGTEHGQVTTCTQCHNIMSPLAGPEDLHATHITFLELEQPLANTATSPDTLVCGYCHGQAPGTPEGTSGGGCYNCHLSGHRPETYYWQALP